MGIKFEIRKALYFALLDVIYDDDGNAVTDDDEADVTRDGLISLDGAYDVAPQADDPALPSVYSVIGTQITRTQDTKTTRGVSVLTRIFTYSRSNSAKEIEDAQDQIFDVLHRNPQQFGTSDVVLVHRVGSDVLPGPDGRFYGVDEYLFEVMKI